MTEKPKFPIRRFDVFAEYNRLKYLSDGMPADQAAGRGVWIAKVVAGRRGGAAAPGKTRGVSDKDGKATTREQPEEKFLSVGGKEQTDQTFEKEIVDRMGRDFYDEVFSPAIARAFEEGLRYEDIRDSIRKEWK
jgi:hypothetical protein